MSTNPNNSVGTNGAYGGRTSVKAFNDILGVLSGRGVLSGWAVSPDNGMTVSVGGVAGKRDVAILEDNNGNRTTANNINEVPILIDIPAAPASNSRIDSIVLYVDNPPQGTANAVDNPAACGLIVVSSDIAGTPTPPSDTAIRAAITADGASGSTAFFCVVADIRIAAGTTNITTNMITMKEKSSAGVSQVNTDDIVDGAVTTAKLGNKAVTSGKIDFASFSSDMTKTVVPVANIDWYVNNVKQASSGLHANTRLTTEISSAGNLFKIYGYLIVQTVTQTQVGEFRFSTNLRPSSEITITGAGIRTNKTTAYVVTTVSNVDLRISTDGTVAITGAVKQANEDVWIWLPPTFYTI